MHETLSENYIGNIDSVKKEGKYYIVRGWVVPLAEAVSCNIGIEGFISIVPEERKDIYSQYRESHINYLRSGFSIVFDPKNEDTFIKVNNEDVFKIHAEVMESILLPSPRIKTEIVVLNNFYSDPGAVRQYALKQKYITSADQHIKRRSVKVFIPSWIQSKFEEVLGNKIKEFVGASGIFQFNTSEDIKRYYINNHEYTAIICLTPSAPESGGISTYKSKYTNLTHYATPADAHQRGVSIDELNTQTFNNNYYDSTNMISLDTIANIYNRLIIYNAKAIHANTTHFGATKEDGRLYHSFFFNC